MTFTEGDAVFIDDGYAGAPHPAVVTGVIDDVLFAEGTEHIPRDSRVVAWTIPSAEIAAMVTARF